MSTNTRSAIRIPFDPDGASYRNARLRQLDNYISVELLSTSFLCSWVHINNSSFGSLQIKLSLVHINEVREAKRFKGETHY